ncbi:N-6 DNA methylase [Luteolibacter algae]|uniref:N-6 DNA methylase n=1 Tax=Luteolibacter algae TaxID=454151 RepID=A0ABW5D7L7_9BACT
MIQPTVNSDLRPFHEFAEYVTKLVQLSRTSHVEPGWESKVDAALNGQAGAELRRVSPLKTRREFGAFFTGTDLGARLLDLCSAFDRNSVIYDPTCGAGDLLVAAARRLPIEKNLNATLTQWGKQLIGTDLHREFVHGARIRLVLLARQRHRSNSKLKKTPAQFFPEIKVANGLRQIHLLKQATHLLLNPPFGLEKVPKNCAWASGKMTLAAEFVANAMEHANEGAELYAILPDVLRSGSFSENWQKHIEQLSEIRRTQSFGIFDSSADIDVFLLHAIRVKQRKLTHSGSWSPLIAKNRTTLGDLFEVRVGTIVPHRDEEIGESYPYIHARSVPAWATVREFSESRLHSGRLFQPPFVVIRRTSRPEQQYRAAASIIAGDVPVAVENHLIVCSPLDRKVGSCRQLIKQLKLPTTNDFLNDRIRCRHLTVKAIKQIPIEG